MSDENYEKLVKIDIKIEYEYLTTTDVEKVLSDIRRPLMKTLQKYDMAGRRDELRVMYVSTENSIEISIGVFLLTYIVQKLLDELIEAIKKSDWNLNRTSKRKNIKSIYRQTTIDGKIIEEAEFDKEER